MKIKYVIVIAILLIVLSGLGTVCAEENVSDVDMTLLGDSDSGTLDDVDTWTKLAGNCSDRNVDHTIYLNGTLTVEDQIEIGNNVTIIGNENSFIIGSYGNIIPFSCSDALNVTFKNVNFQNLSGNYLMKFSGNGNYLVDGCTFSDITSSSSVIHSNYGITNITNCTFTNCNVKTGVINNYYAVNSATAYNARLYVTDSRFRNNNASSPSSHSGAIANSGYLVVNNSTFDSNYAVQWAGAIHTAAYANTTIYDSNFTNNVAGWNGGALYTYSNLQIYNCNFISNNCTTNNGGGAIGACKLYTEPNIYVFNSTFENNINNCGNLGGNSTTGVGRGGAISIMDDGTLRAYNNRFIGNDAMIGSAISAISQVSWGSPDVEIVGNKFINHTGALGSDVLVVSLLNSNYLVENNTYINDKISLAKFRLDIDENNNGNVTVNITLRLKHPEYYDSDIITKSGFRVYIDENTENNCSFAINTTSFTCHFNDSLNHTIKVVPLFLYNEYRDYSAFDTIYVSTIGNDNNSGADRNSAVRTIKKALELVNGTNYIKILEGTYYERSLTISEDLIIEGEGNVILVGNSSDVNTFTVNSPSVGFSNLKFMGITGGKAIGTDGNFIVNITDCSFYSNVGKRLIEVYGLNIKDSIFDSNVADFAIYTSNFLNMENCNISNNRLMSTSTNSNSIVNIAKGIISNSTFTNNNGRRGILRINGNNNVSIYESKFINNTASNYGGAIYASSANNIDIVSSVFYNNTANSRGGAIYTDSSVSNLNITYSILIGNRVNNNRNYQIDRASTNTNIFAINNWWGNTDENPFTAPTFYNDVNVNASIWLVLVSTCDSVLYNPNESTVVTFDLTYTNKLGSDAPPGSNETGNLTPFRIDGIYLPVLEGVLSTVNGNVNVTNVSLVDGKTTVLFTATGYRSGLIMDVLGISCRCLWIIPFLWENDLKSISDNLIDSGEISSQKYYSDDLLGYGLPPDEWEDVCEFMQECNIILYNNCAILHPFLEESFFENWMDDDDYDDFESNGIPDKYFKEDNFHVNLSIFNSSTQKWDNVVEDSYCLPFPYTCQVSYPNHVSIFNFTKGLYKLSMVYDGQDIEYEYYDENDDCVSGVYTYEPRSWEAELNLTGNFLNPSINNLNSVISYENSYIKINPQIACKYDNWRHPVQYEEEQDDDYGSVNTFALLYNNKNYDFSGKTTFLWGGEVKINDSAYNPDDFPEVKPVNITMTITQGDGVIKEFSVAPSDTYSFNDLAAGEYNLTAVYDDPYYGYATKTVTITVNKNIWDNAGADEGYSHQTEYYGPKNVEPLWNLTVNASNSGNINEIFGTIVNGNIVIDSSYIIDSNGHIVIDNNGNIYITNGSSIIVLNSEGNIIKKLDDSFSRGLALSNNYLISSRFLPRGNMNGAYYWDILNNYARNEFPNGGWGSSGDKVSTTSEYAPVVYNGKTYIVSWEFYPEENDDSHRYYHIYSWSENKHSNHFLGALDAPSIDSEGYIYVNTKSGLVILDPELNITDLSFGDVGKYGRPVIDSADMVYVFNADRTIVYSLNRETGIEWNRTINGGACGVMAVDVENNALYIVGNDGILYKLNRGNGEITEFYNLGTNASSILVDGRGTIYLGCADGVLYAVTNEGKLLFKYTIGDVISKDMVLDNNGTLYVYANNKVYALTGAPRLYSEITINVSDAEVNRKNTIVATLPENATGNVTFIIDDTITSDEIPIINGNATWTAPGLLSGPHTVKVTWIGDSEYFGSEATEEFNVYKVNSTIDLEDSINYVGKLTQLNITLPEDAVGNVTVTFNHKSKSVKIVNGTATFEISDLEAGNYAIDFSWDGDERYFGNASYAYFTVIKNDAGLTITADQIKEGEDLNVTVTVSDDESGIILINVGDVKDYATIKDGKVNFIISGLAADTYDITAEYIGDNKYNNATETSHVVVSAKDKPAIEINPNVIVEDDKSSVEVTLPDDATGYILLEVNGNTFYANVTRGKVIVPVSGLDADTSYPVTVTYSGDDNYSAATKEGEIKTPEVKLLDSGLKLDIADTVISVSINESATGKVIVTVGDISFVGDAQDLEAIDVSEYLANGTYDVTVEYLGDGVFANATKTSTVTVPEEPVVEPKDPNLNATASNTTISVSVDKAAAGNVLVDVGGTGFYAPIKNGKASVEVTGLEAGKSYKATVSYVGNDEFKSASTSVTVNVPAEPVVEPKDPKLEATPSNTTISVSVDKAAAGNVLVDVGGTGFYAPIKDGQASVEVTGLEAGKSYKATVSYEGNDEFKSASTTVTVNVPAEPVVEPKDSNLKVDVDGTVITVSVNESATGDVIVTVDDISFIQDAQALTPIDVSEYLTNGTYPVTVKYVGDDVFAEKVLIGGKVTVPEEPVVEPKDPQLKATATNTTISVSVDKDATGNVLVDVGGTGFYAPIKDGKAVINVIGLDAGKYNAVVSYAGDDNFKAASTAVAITVPEEPVVGPKDPNLKVTAVNNTITATVDKDAAGSIMVDVDGQGYYAPIKDGKAVINVIGLDEGTYQATVTYAGDDTFKAAETTVSVTVPKKEDTEPEPVDPKADIKISDDEVSVSLPGDATGYVLVDVDGQGLYAPVKDGKATVELPELASGNHTVTVTYTGDKKYSSANATQTINVEEDIPTVIAENLTKVEKAPDRFEALFTDADGKALANADVTFELNGNKYTRTTDANGKAGMNINLSPGTYTMVTTNPVTKESVTNTIAVLPRLEGNDLTKYFKNASQYRIKVYDDNGNPVKAGEVVTFNINGVFYNRTTDKDGYAQLSINLAAGDYVCTAEYKGCRISNNIKVLPILTAKDLTKKYGQQAAFEATLVDGQGKAYANQDVEFNINGVFYKRATDSNGVAKLNINLQAGKYIITSSYNGFNIANTVTVTA